MEISQALKVIRLLSEGLILTLEKSWKMKVLLIGLKS